MKSREPKPATVRSEEPEPRLPEGPTSADETTSSDPVIDSDAFEDRTPSSTANGLSPNDPADGERRRKLYEQGANLVSRID